MPTPDLEPLLARSNWVHALARSLAADPHAADDLVQDAWVAALERPPPDDALLARWFAVVMQNFARQRWRGAIRRAAREHAVARDAAVGSDVALLERLELSRALAAEVAELAEPYRTAILLRYFEGLAPREIARRLDVPLRTVHTRLNRALAKLRGELQRDPERWTLALLPFGGSIAGESGRTLGALLMSTATKVTCVALVLAGAVAWTLLGTNDAQTAPPLVDTKDLSVDAGARAISSPENALAASESAGDRRSVDAARATEGATESGRVVEPIETVAAVHGYVIDTDNVPRSGIAVSFRSFGEEHVRDEMRARTDVRGRFSIPIGDERGRLCVEEPGWTTVLEPQLFGSLLDREQVLVVSPTRPIDGIVIDEQRAPLAGAKVMLRAPDGIRTRFDRVLDQSSETAWKAETDELGRFAVPDAPAIEGAILRTELAGYETDQRALRAASASSFEIVLSRGTAEIRWLSGRVVDAAGSAVEDAWVGLGEVSTRSDRSGSFTLMLEKSNTASRLWAVKSGFLPAELAPRGESSFADDAWPQPLILKLGGASLEIRGRVVDARGAPVEGAEILTDDTTFFGKVPYESGAETFQFDVQVETLVRDELFGGGNQTDEEGRFTLSGLLAEAYRIYAFDPHQLVYTRTAPIEAGTHDVEIRLPDDKAFERLAGRVLDRSGRPVAGAEVTVARDVRRAMGRDKGDMDVKTNGEGKVTDAEGRFEFLRVSKAATGIEVDGDMVAIGSFHPLRGGFDPERIDIVVALKCHAQIELASPTLEADECELQDARGEMQRLIVSHGNLAYSTERVALVAGRSEVFSVSDDAQTLLLFKAGVEVRRLTVALRAGELNLIRP